MSNNPTELGPALDEAEVSKAKYAEVRDKLRETEERVTKFMLDNIMGSFPVGSRENVAQKKLFSGLRTLWGKPEYGDVASDDPARIYYSCHKNAEGSLFVDFVIDGEQYSVQLRFGKRQMALYSGDKELVYFYDYETHVPYYVDRNHLCGVSPDGRGIQSATSSIRHEEAEKRYWEARKEAEAKPLSRIRGKLAELFKHINPSLTEDLEESRRLALLKVLPQYPHPTPIYEVVLPMDEMLKRLEIMRVGLEIMMDSAQRTLDESEPINRIDAVPTIDDEDRLLA